MASNPFGDSDPHLLNKFSKRFGNSYALTKHNCSFFKKKKNNQQTNFVAFPRRKHPRTISEVQSSQSDSGSQPRDQNEGYETLSTYRSGKCDSFV